ncbi:Hypothetical predicted protein [Paramuricea clavata]|uniref:Uncharacterized protein n=1 Tax=Paramuricea clavata TaxID=317549 RepID=A0A7D9J6E6_PARCT|nr:Hypothetical predicted protein [Paramuricea clavata]
MYNTAVHTSTGVSPYELVFKEHPRSKFELITEKISPATVREKMERLRETVSEVFQKAQESDDKLAEKRRERYNNRWTGPYVVVKPSSVTKTSYVVRRNNGTKEEIVHYNYLKPYQIRPVKKPKSRNPPKKNGVGHPALGTSEDSESDSREEEMQPERSPERIRIPPEKIHIILLKGGVV